MESESLEPKTGSEYDGELTKQLLNHIIPQDISGVT